MRIGAGGAEVGAAAGLALFIAGDADAVAVVNELIGVAGLDATRAKLEVSVGALDTDIASACTSLTFGVARLTLSINGKIVDWALGDADTVHSITV